MFISKFKNIYTRNPRKWIFLFVGRSVFLSELKWDLNFGEDR